MLGSGTEDIYVCMERVRRTMISKVLVSDRSCANDTPLKGTSLSCSNGMPLSAVFAVSPLFGSATNLGVAGSCRNFHNEAGEQVKARSLGRGFETLIPYQASIGWRETCCGL